MDSIFSVIVGGSITIVSVIVERKISDWSDKKSKLELSKKILTDLVIDIEKQLAKTETVISEVNTISLKPLEKLKDLIDDYFQEKIHIYSIENSDARNKIHTFFNEFEETFLENAFKEYKSISLKDSNSIDNSFVDKVRNKKKECEGIKEIISKAK